MSDKDSRTIGNSLEQTKEYHVRYLRAINSPIRRQILQALKDSDATIEELHSRTGLSPDSLSWHLNILEYGFCVEKTIKEGKTIYTLTKEGKVIDYL